MEQLGRSIVASERAAKLHTVTRLLVGRKLVNQEQKEADIVALSWCSEASNTSSERDASVPRILCVGRLLLKKAARQQTQYFLFPFNKTRA